MISVNTQKVLSTTDSSVQILLSVLNTYSTYSVHKGTNIDLPDKLSLVTDDSSDVISPTMLSITELKYLALTLVIFLLAFKLKRDLFLAKPCITPAISASKLFSLRSRRDKHFTVPIQFSKTLAPCTERLLFDKFSSTLVVASLQAKPTFKQTNK